MTRSPVDPDRAARVGAAQAEAPGAETALPLLTAALDDPAVAIRRAAVVALGKLGDLRGLPALMRALAAPAPEELCQDIEQAIRNLLLAAAHQQPRTPSPEAAEAVQHRIDALAPEPLRDWPTRVCKEELNALPIHAGSALYVWAVRPDGTVLCLDLDALREPAEPESDPVVRFAVVTQGARRYPELAEFIPPPPENIRFCDRCRGIGAGADQGQECGRCNGLGWYVAAG